MAQKVITTLIDDLEGGVADETVRFALDGHEYEIDLSREHAGELRAALAPVIAAGRKARTNGKRRKQPSKVTQVEADPAAVRAWAASQGIEVAAKGRVSASVVERFNAAQGEGTR